MIGKPIQCDRLTASMSRLSFARVLIEMDFIANLMHSIEISLPNRVRLVQLVVYKTLPKFCRTCKVLEHTMTTCAKAKKELSKAAEGRFLATTTLWETEAAVNMQ